MSRTTRLSSDAETLQVMISLYCRKRHGSNNLCPECSELTEYAADRLANCPFGEDKPVCRDCLVHCYEPKFRERIREVMRYTGPRIIFRHPIIAFRHLLNRVGRDSSNAPGENHQQSHADNHRQ
ncbi:MAG: nitrous oxide-stimulated promoter family protein [Spirochaetaceae bacterium]|nr:nitrous oxide-stimulated promoter family protein [Spirochaetaceae bacterium]